ncbi:MAG: OFA family MFS transporter [Candidatus Marinimicrobia bacterium]|jgi:MFS family permease|nr:OFA family MFS transporter [Candidatus Neomarinimicrobiota bacterium]MBT3617259.1 OFA family MFS transporter [Candidatus Neomarinimicrobiota bacterium]MBT3828822.1 OFA family MFS transporter [Candidatus Neomarinimicrobiota bacterium]MBT3997793.1 OFA family MFS transporter [Candidatus Neomarinimicrobiota bacterium]MBT4280507.1 OFA family MFS transporter [Candidatus Neomarinimicrobiota bacterium]
MIKEIKNRWFVVVGAVMIQLALGAIYAWSVFTKILTDPVGVYQFTAKETALIFSAGLATFAFVMILAGKLQVKYAPQKIAVSGGILFGIGYIFSGIFGSTFVTQFIFIGILGGAGIGLAYVVPISVGVKWFPDKKGMITGLAVAGFGFGATIWVKLADSWFGGLLNTISFFGLPNVQSVFLIYGIVFTGLVLLGSIVMVNPPDDYYPEGWKEKSTSSRHVESVELSSRQMLRTPQFYFIWGTFIFSALSGLMVIYCIRLFGVDALKYHGVQNAGILAGTAMAWYAIFNGAGRIIWGILSDRIGRRISIIVMTIFQGIIMLMVYHVFISVGSSIGFIISASIIGFNFGGNFALFPAITADYFGNKNVGSNYGWVFSAYGIAGIAGPFIAGFFKDSAESANDPSVWMIPFIIAGVSCILGAIVMYFNHPPK